MAQETESTLDTRDCTRAGTSLAGFARPPATASARPEIHITIHHDLAAVESEWRAFEQRADCTVFQSFGWLSAWQSHVGSRQGVRPAIVIGRNARDDILFLLPLALDPRGPARRLVWLGSGSSDYNAPMLAPAFAQTIGASRWVRLLWPEIQQRIQDQPASRFDLVHFVRMPEMVGAQQNPFRHLPVTVHPSRCYLVHLSGTWESLYASKRSGTNRKHDRSKLQRLRNRGGVAFITPTGPEEIARSLDTLMAQKARSFAARGVPNLFARPGHADFYRSVAVDPSTCYIAHVSRLDVGTVPAAINLGLNFRGCYYLVLSSYDDGEISRLSPGTAHRHELMRHAIATGCKTFDFTVGDEPYKREWSDVDSPLFDHLSMVRWRGALVVGPMLGLLRAKRFIKQTPALWSIFTEARAFAGRLCSRLSVTGRTPDDAR